MKIHILAVLLVFGPLSAQAFFPQTTYLSCDAPAARTRVTVRVGAYAGENFAWGLEIYEFDKQTQRASGLTDHLSGQMKPSDPQLMAMVEGRDRHVVGVIRRTGPQSFVYQDKRFTLPCTLTPSRS